MIVPTPTRRRQALLAIAGAAFVVMQFQAPAFASSAVGQEATESTATTVDQGAPLPEPSVPETSVPDTSLPETGVPETSVAARPVDESAGEPAETFPVLGPPEHVRPGPPLVLAFTGPGRSRTSSLSALAIGLLLSGTALMTVARVKSTKELRQSAHAPLVAQ